MAQAAQYLYQSLYDTLEHGQTALILEQEH